MALQYLLGDFNHGWTNELIILEGDTFAANGRFLGEDQHFLCILNILGGGGVVLMHEWDFLGVEDEHAFKAEVATYLEVLL